MPKRFVPIRKAASGSPTTATRQVGIGLFTTALAVVQTSLIAWFGFELSGRLELALKDRQMTLQAASAMAKLVEQMQDENRDAAVYKALVRKIAMHGSDAVQPLTIMAAATGPYSGDIPLIGLKLVAVQHKKETCNSLQLAIAAEDTIDGARFIGIKKLHEDLKCSPSSSSR